MKEVSEKSFSKSSVQKKHKKIKKNPSKPKQNFLKYFKKKEKKNGVINWNQTGTSFIVSNTEQFIKILPKYFKTKNYSSFVRQLNMYDFHKIKNIDGYHEFKHPQFKRGNIEDLEKIKRKVNDYSQGQDEFKGDKKIIMSEYQKLKKNYQDMEESLSIIATQNKRLVDSNKDLVCQLYFFKKEYEIRMRKLLFLFFVLLKYYTPELIQMIQNQLNQQSMQQGNTQIQNVGFNNLNEYINQVSQQLLFSSDKSDNWLNSLFELFKKYLSDNNSSNQQDSENLQKFFDQFFQNENQIKQIGQNQENQNQSTNQKLQNGKNYINQIQGTLNHKNNKNIETKSQRNDIKDSYAIENQSNKLFSENSNIDDSKSDINSINLFTPSCQTNNDKKGFFNF